MCRNVESHVDVSVGLIVQCVCETHRVTEEDNISSGECHVRSQKQFEIIITK